MGSLIGRARLRLVEKAVEGRGGPLHDRFFGQSSFAT